jgi:hypothetical protein
VRFFRSRTTGRIFLAGLTVTWSTARAALAPLAVAPGCAIGGSTRTVTFCFLAACWSASLVGLGLDVAEAGAEADSGAGDPEPGALVQATTRQAARVAAR